MKKAKDVSLPLSFYDSYVLRSLVVGADAAGEAFFLSQTMAV